VRALVAEGELETEGYLRQGLSENGFVVEICRDGEDGLHQALAVENDVIILNLMNTESTKRNSFRRIALGVAIGILLLGAVVWLVTRTLGNTPRSQFAGKPLQYWQEQLDGHDSGDSNAAFAVINSQVIPGLVNTLFCDTNDSSLRISLINTLNTLPGVQIYFADAGARRADAVRCIGEFGPAATSAVPALIQALNGKDAVVHEAALRALGSIHSNPDTMVPFLTGYLDNDTLRDEAALALANYGPRAKSAVPKIIPLLQAADKDDRTAAIKALKQIDPDSYLAAAKAVQGSGTNHPAAKAEGAGSAKPK